MNEPSLNDKMNKESTTSISLDDSAQSLVSSDSGVNLNMTLPAINSCQVSSSSFALPEGEKRSSEKVQQGPQDGSKIHKDATKTTKVLSLEEATRLYGKDNLLFKCGYCPEYLKIEEIDQHFTKNANTHRRLNQKELQLMGLGRSDPVIINSNSASDASEQIDEILSKSPTVATTTPNSIPTSPNRPNHDDNDAAPPDSENGELFRSIPLIDLTEESDGDFPDADTGPSTYNNLSNPSQEPSSSSSTHSNVPSHNQHPYPQNWNFPHGVQSQSAANMPPHGPYYNDNYNMWQNSFYPYSHYPQDQRGYPDPYGRQDLNYVPPTQWYQPNSHETWYSAGHPNYPPYDYSTTVGDHNYRQNVSDLGPGWRGEQGAPVQSVERAQPHVAPTVQRSFANGVFDFVPKIKCKLKRKQRKSHPCPYCLRYFQHAAAVKSHIAEWQRQTADLPPNRYTCEHCERRFDSGYSVVHHQQSTHNLNPKLSRKYCHLCGMPQANQGSLRVHELRNTCRQRYFPGLSVDNSRHAATQTL